MAQHHLLDQRNNQINSLEQDRLERKRRKEEKVDVALQIKDLDISKLNKQLKKKKNLMNLENPHHMKEKMKKMLIQKNLDMKKKMGMEKEKIIMRVKEKVRLRGKEKENIKKKRIKKKKKKKGTRII